MNKRIDELSAVIEDLINQMCEGFCKDLPTADYYEPDMDIDCVVCKARSVLNKGVDDETD